jgi:hypothetical protein
MNTKQFLILSASALTLGLFSGCKPVFVEERQGQLVRLAELEIDPAQLENYKAALREEIDASIRIEPGVLTLYAVAEKDSPSRGVVA